MVYRVVLPCVIIGFVELVILILNWSNLIINSWLLLFKILVILIFWVFPLLLVGFKFINEWESPVIILYIFAFIAIPLVLGITIHLFLNSSGGNILDLFKYLFWY